MIKWTWREGLALFLVLFLYAVSLFGTSVPFTGDQKVYISVAAEMSERAEVLTPYLFDRPNFLKPPFQYWMTLGGWKLFGFNPFGTFFPSVLALIICAALVYLLSRRNALLNAVWFSATLGTLTYGTTAQMEIWITLFYLLSWLLFLQQKLFLAFVAVGIMSWIKGPLYPVLWALGALLFVILKRDFSIFKNSRVWLALGLGVLVGTSWYVIAYSLHPQEVSDVFFKRENFEKVQTHQGSMLGLWGDFLFSLVPALFWMLISFNREQWKQNWSENRFFFISFGLIFFLFFSFFPYRVGAYLYPLTPLVIWMFAFDRPEQTRWVSVVQKLLLVVGIALEFLLVRLFWGDWLPFHIFIVFSVVLLGWVVAHFMRSPRGAAWTAFAMVMMIRWSAISLGESDLAGLSRYLEQNPEQEIAYWTPQEDIWHEWGWTSIATQKHIHRLKTEEEIEDFLDRGGALILSDEQQEKGTGLKCADWPRMKRRIKFPMKEMIVSGLKRTDPSLLRTFRVCSRRQG